MKVKSDVLYKSFFISLIAFAIIAAIILGGLYFDRIAVDPTQRSSNILVGLTDGNDIISLTFIHCDPKNNSLSFLPVPDNTMLQDGRILQEFYSIARPSELIRSLENLTGAVVNRYIFFTVDAMAELVDSLGKFEYLIRYPFTYNGNENSGNANMNGELAKAMFTYKSYDRSKVSMSHIAEAFIQSFLSKHGNASNINKMADSIVKSASKYRVNTDLTDEEIYAYCSLFSSFSQFAKHSVALEGETKTGSSNQYFVPDYTKNKNIFK